MDLITYTLCKKLAAQTAAGINNIEVDGQDLKIYTTSGDVFTIPFPASPNSTIADCNINEENHLIMIFENGNEIDCGELSLDNISMGWGSI